MKSSIKSSKKSVVSGIFYLAAILVLLGLPSWGECKSFKRVSPQDKAEEAQDKTLSPYFFIQSDDPTLDPMPLKLTQVDVQIAGVIADVKVTQLYKNEGKRPIEAIYVFPASTRAAVYGMKMTIGDRTIVAEIRKREEARQAYEQAKIEGKSASLLEQHRPNVFQMNVANILPGDEIRSELHYTELLMPTDKVYDFVYPTVVGPRYSNESSRSARKSEKWIENPYLQEGQLPSNKLEISVSLNSGLPIQELTCSSHKTDIKFLSRSTASVNLAETEKFAGNRDFVLQYRLAGEQIESGLILNRGEDENFFLLMMQPPERITEKKILPREYVFIVDVSGSMHGFPLDVSKRLLVNLIGGLRPSDMFNVVLFAGGSQIFSPQSLPANQKNIQQAIDLIDRERGGGGTELLPALKKAFGLPRTEGFSRTLIIATDGYVSVEKEAFDFIRSHLTDCNFFTFGIGTSVNRYLIEGMARAGMGEPFVISRPDDAAPAAERFRGYVQAPVLTNIKIDFNGFDAFEVEPVSVPDIFADRPVVVFGKWRGELQGKISVEGISGSGKYHRNIDLEDKKASSANSALKYLWARSRIAQLDDYNRLSSDKDLISEVTSLGLKYHLLTAYTSFVAIDEHIRLKDGKAVTVKQPLPLPEGVSNLAVGEMPASPMAASLSYRAAPMGGVSKESFTQAAVEKKSEKSEPQADKDQGITAGKGRVGECQIQLLKVEAIGGLPREVVNKVVIANLAKIQSCMCKGLTNSSAVKIVVRWHVNEKGEVEEIEIEPKGAISEALRSCIIDVFRRLKFEKAELKTNVSAYFEISR